MSGASRWAASTSLVDRRHLAGAVPDLLRDRRHRRRQLGPAAVVDAEGQRHPAVGGRERLGVVERRPEPAREALPAPADEADADPSGVPGVAPGEQHALGVGEQRPQLTDRLAPARVRDEVDGQPPQPDLQRALDDVDQRRLAHRAAVAVGHDRDVTGDLVEVELGHPRNLSLPLSRPNRTTTLPPMHVPEAWTAVMNPAAGRGRGRARLPLVADALADAGLDLEIELSADPDHLVTLARDAFARGRAVVACGGDGTVCALAGVAADHDGVLGIVPVGSGNDFARQLDIPRDDVAAAIDVLRTGHVVRADLGRVQTADGRDDVVHHRRQHRVRRRRQRVGQPGHLDQRRAALRAGHAAHPRHLPTTALPSHRRRHRDRHRRVAGRGGQHAHVRERDGDHAGGERARRPARRVRRRPGVARRLPPHVPVGLPRGARRASRRLYVARHRGDGRGARHRRAGGALGQR